MEPVFPKGHISNRQQFIFKERKFLYIRLSSFSGTVNLRGMLYRYQLPIPLIVMFSREQLMYI